MFVSSHHFVREVCYLDFKRIVEARQPETSAVGACLSKSETLVWHVFWEG